jgi:hypothetical protein
MSLGAKKGFEISDTRRPIIFAAAEAQAFEQSRWDDS